jgi:aspartate ammonia-lyase
MVMGPRTGIDEIKLPAVQPGSSIMPGKINPSIPEMVNQVCFQVMGCDTTVAIASEHGQLELNVMMPVIAHNILLSMQILTSTATVLTRRRCAGSRRTRRCASTGWSAPRRSLPRSCRASATRRRPTSASAR